MVSIKFFIVINFYFIIFWKKDLYSFLFEEFGEISGSLIM